MLLQRQPHRAAVVGFAYVVVAALVTRLLVLLLGFFPGCTLALLLVPSLLVPAAVMARVPKAPDPHPVDSACGYC